MEGNITSAINIYEYLCGKYPENSEILVNFINVLIADKRMDYAKSKFEELKKVFPDNSSIQEFEKVFAEAEDSADDTNKKTEK